MSYAATIGTFDGVHRGHCFLLQQLREVARLHNLSTLALTFREHPTVTLGRQAPPQLSTIEDKLSSLRKEVDEVRVLHFTPDMARLTAREFMQLLRDQYSVRLLLLGHDHRFGRPQPDDDYERFGRELGIEIHRAEPLYLTSDPTVAVSSTAIRQALQEGRLAEAQQMLGRPYSIVGEVVRGFQVGRTIGFPTANIAMPLLVPASGVYAVEVQLPAAEGSAPRVMLGVLNVGSRPTLNNGSETSVEVHIPGYQGDLYGCALKVAFIRRLRDEQKFASLEALKAQIARDIAALT